MLDQMEQDMSPMGELSDQALSAEQMDEVLSQLEQCKNCVGGASGDKPGDKKKVRVKRMAGTGKSQYKAGSGRSAKTEGMLNLEEQGSTNLEQRGGPGRSWSDRTLPPADYVKLYDPRRTQVQAEDLRSRSAVGEGAILGTVEVESQPRKEEVKTPYRETFESFRSAAEDALEQEQVPLKYRPVVRRYFDEVDGVADQDER